MQEKYWKYMVQIKAWIFYLDVYTEDSYRWDRIINIVVAIASSTSIAAWAIWQKYSFVWSIIIAISQVLTTIKGFLPYSKRLKMLVPFMEDLKFLYNKIEYNWFKVASGDLSEDEINELLYSFKDEFANIENKNLKEETLLEKIILEKLPIGKMMHISLLVEALYGGAMNLLGEVSPGSIYSYIDRSLGAWDEQRPLFKANISSFVSLRKNAPPIPIAELRQITEIFTSQYDEYPLDPTYEPDKHEADVKDVNKEHEAIFATLQRFVKLNLVIPVGEEHMYYAAIHHKSCKLTAQGQHYWQLVNKNTI